MSQTLNEQITSMSKDEQRLLALRHTAEHVLHTAMQNLYPSLKKAMGPAINTGFYFDFELDKKISVDDFQKIEKEMQRLISQDLKMVQEHITIDKAKKIFQENHYKLEWINLISKRNEDVSIYKMIDRSGNIYDIDLCSGPHIKSTAQVKAFKLLSVAGAYWHGDEKNIMLTRIYGTAFFCKKDLDGYLEILEEAKKRDHRKIGKDLNLFVFSDLIGKGLPLLTPKGTIIRKELENFIYQEETKKNYTHVITPHLANVALYKTSGHYPYYKESMYPIMKVDEEELILRPMTCPHHFMLYKSNPHSYKELPIRYAELASQFRYEKSGELTGLTRVRTFCLSDAHIFCTREQAKQEIIDVLELIDYVNTVLKLEKGKKYWYRLSLGDRSDNNKFYKNESAWNEAENILRNVLNEKNENYIEAPGEAAFYGPKIDVQMKKINGQEETAFTVQYDFVMPKRFQLSYTDKDGKEQEPIVIHRSSIGAFERLMAFLIEEYKGNFPLWLSPIQVVILPISDKSLSFAQKVYKEFKRNNIRTEFDDDNKTIGAKIRHWTLQKVNYMCIIGEKEQQKSENGKMVITIRTREGKEIKDISVIKFISELKEKIEKKV